MSTGDTVSEHAFEGTPEATKDKTDPPGRRSDAMLLLPLGISGVAVYAALGYGVYALASSFL